MIKSTESLASNRREFTRQDIIEVAAILWARAHCTASLEVESKHAFDWGRVPRTHANTRRWASPLDASMNEIEDVLVVRDGAGPGRGQFCPLIFSKRPVKRLGPDEAYCRHHSDD